MRVQHTPSYSTTIKLIHHDKNGHSDKFEVEVETTARVELEMLALPTFTVAAKIKAIAGDICVEEKDGVANLCLVVKDVVVVDLFDKDNKHIPDWIDHNPVLELVYKAIEKREFKVNVPIKDIKVDESTTMRPSGIKFDPEFCVFSILVKSELKPKEEPLNILTM